MRQGKEVSIREHRAHPSEFQTATPEAEQSREKQLLEQAVAVGGLLRATGRAHRASEAVDILREASREERVPSVAEVAGKMALYEEYSLDDVSDVTRQRRRSFFNNAYSKERIDGLSDIQIHRMTVVLPEIVVAHESNFTGKTKKYIGRNLAWLYRWFNGERDFEIAADDFRSRPEVGISRKTLMRNLGKGVDLDTLIDGAKALEEIEKSRWGK